MRIEYINTVERYKLAMKLNMKHSYPIRRWLGLVVAVVAIVIGVQILFYSEFELTMIGGGVLGAGIGLLIKRFTLYSWAAKSAFKNKPEQESVIIEADNGGLSAQTESGESRNKWKAFLKFIECDEGLLLYFQPRLYLWIPRDAKFTDGTWSDFMNIITKNIKL